MSRGNHHQPLTLKIGHPKIEPHRPAGADSRHRCPACPQSFSTDELYKEHYKTAHKDRTAY